uniref:Uncharacterized protein n=1 Tax=Globisporangium ultimum (strain ATCC 200006 / CBS 805.95 / DAOM BR144) TaxID=431595 RepID=K3WPJ8_GLOUD
MTNIAVFQQERQRLLLHDFALLLFSMLYRNTIPRNADAMRTEYLGGPKDAALKFCFEYFVPHRAKKSPLRRPHRHDKQQQPSHEIIVSEGDKFRLVIDGAGSWRLGRFENAGIVTCTHRQASPFDLDEERKSNL